ncbi:MAG: hypothetical protein RLZZ337_721 [Bacteroidota bacterium]|jgi:hypothetical protein
MIFYLHPFFRFLLPKHITAITLWPFIFFRDKDKRKDTIIINHEKIHLRQQLELLVLPFYIIYLLEYVFYVIKYRNHDKAYRSISFEREAYRNEGSLSYLKQRKPWNTWRVNC